MKPKRIAVWQHLPSGGGKRALYHHVKGLAERGHHLEVWCPTTADRQYLPLIGMAAEHLIAYSRESYQARGAWDRLIAYKGWRKRFRAIDEHCRLCAEEINHGHFDVLLAANCIDVCVSPIGRHVTIPKLLYHQEPNRAFYEARPTLPWIAPPAEDGAVPLLAKFKHLAKDFDFLRSIREEAREERSSAEAFDRLLVNSAFSRESVLRAYGLDSKVCYLGVDTALFKARGAERESFVVGLGSMHPHKGVQTAIEALATLPAPNRPS